jgi:cytochrome bd-type quinol oxidase subunit 2
MWIIGLSVGSILAALVFGFLAFQAMQKKDTKKALMTGVLAIVMSILAVIMYMMYKTQSTGQIEKDKAATALLAQQNSAVRTSTFTNSSSSTAAAFALMEKKKQDCKKNCPNSFWHKKKYNECVSSCNDSASFLMGG